VSYLPVRRQQFRTAKFLAWLAANGAEVGQPTNPYEVVRYRAYGRQGGKAETHIVYAKENGLLTFTGNSRLHYENYVAGLPLASVTLNPVVVPMRPQEPSDAASSSVRARRRSRLLKRDGDGCWFCGDPMGEDMTLEHLLPQSKGGSNDPANLVLAHRDCNNRAADLSVSEKVELRAQLRSARADA